MDGRVNLIQSLQLVVLPANKLLNCSGKGHLIQTVVPAVAQTLHGSLIPFHFTAAAKMIN